MSKPSIFSQDEVKINNVVIEVSDDLSNLDTAISEINKLPGNAWRIEFKTLHDDALLHKRYTKEMAMNILKLMEHKYLIGETINFQLNNNFSIDSKQDIIAILDFILNSKPNNKVITILKFELRSRFSFRKSYTGTYSVLKDLIDMIRHGDF